MDADDRTIELIQARLDGIERRDDVSVLFAVESGSRAWGFESTNSDWDVRFIYVHKPAWYFKVDEQRDVIELMDGDLDLSGWELRKALGLLKRSNPSLHEWLNSPVVYRADEAFMKRIQEVKPMFFNPIASMYHYVSMYVKHDERYLQKEDCSMKRFLYYLRGVLACKWIEREVSQPPVSFQQLVRAVVEEAEMRTKIDALVGLKKSGEEHGMTVVDGELEAYARRWAEYYKEKVGTFRPTTPKVRGEVLDAILYDMVMSRGEREIAEQ